MHAGRPSLTASVVALFRAFYAAAPAPLGVVNDRMTASMLPLPVRLLARAGAVVAWRAPGIAHWILRVGTLGMAPHVALRTAAIDDALRDALASGIRQVVILGAGLDPRAYRMDELRDTVVFEVDHPATQAYKRTRVAEYCSKAHTVHFVAVDFERERLDEALARAGHRADIPTFWLWEGVTMYLPPAAVDGTLAQLASRSAPGSKLAVTYVTPDLSVGSWLARRVILWGFALIGEPLRGPMSTEEIAARLTSVGFVPSVNESTREWAVRYWPADYVRGICSRERLVVAERGKNRADTRTEPADS